MSGVPKESSLASNRPSTSRNLQSAEEAMESVFIHRVLEGSSQGKFIFFSLFFFIKKNWVGREAKSCLNRQKKKKSFKEPSKPFKRA